MVRVGIHSSRILLTIPRVRIIAARKYSMVTSLIVRSRIRIRIRICIRGMLVIRRCCLDIHSSSISCIRTIITHCHHPKHSPCLCQMLVISMSRMNSLVRSRRTRMCCSIRGRLSILRIRILTLRICIGLCHDRTHILIRIIVTSLNRALVYMNSIIIRNIAMFR